LSHITLLALDFKTQEEVAVKLEPVKSKFP
jgi:serine/threonine protein kinase